VNEIEIVVASKDRSDLDKVATKAKQAGKEIGDGIQKGVDQAENATERGGKRIRDALGRIQKSGRDAGEGLASGLGEALDGIASSVGGPLGDLGGVIQGGLSGAKAGALAGGAALGAFIVSGIESEMAEDKVGGLLAAQTGAASSSAEQLGDTAGNVFADNFGESIEQVGDAMSSVFENKLIKTDAPQAAIEDVTAKIMTLSQVTGEEFDRIGAATSRMVKNDLAGSVSEAFDLIGAAQEAGLNASGDLIDTLEEYSTKFRDLGLNGAESLGLIEQAMEGGARNTDVAADALKEFAIRAQDMSVTTRRGFETIGLDADVMGRRVAAGGDSAKQALRDTLNALSAMPPGVDRATAAVDLFGTKAEDLGQSLYSMDLDDAAKKFENVGGTVEEQMKKISDATSFWDKLGKSVSTAAGAIGELLDTDFAGSIMEDMPELTGFLEEINRAQQDFDATGSMAQLDALKEKYPELADEVDAYVEKTREEKGATDDANDSAANYTETLEELIAQKQELAGVILDVRDASRNWQEAIDEAEQSIKDNGKTLDESTEKGRNNAEALDNVAQSALDMAESMTKNGASVEDVNGFLEQAGAQLLDTADKMGMAKDQAVAYGIQLGLIPNTVATYMQLLGYDYAAARAIQFRNYINSIPDNKTVNLRVSAQGGGHYLAGMAHGGIVSQQPWGAATGGQRHSSTVINEAGPEVVELPSGARVATAGATRAMAEAGWLGGGGGAVVVEWGDGPVDPLARAFWDWIRDNVRVRYRGDVQRAFGQ
jgi:hypothetical protein